MSIDKVFIIVCYLVVLKANSQSTGWELAKDKNDVQVYTRSNEGSKFKEFKAITIISTTNLTKTTALIENVTAYPDWQANIGSIKVLKFISSGEKYFHYTADVPWPISDRDGITYMKKSLIDSVITYQLDSKHDYIPIKDNCLRLKIAKGSWTLTPLKDNKTKVVYQFFGDPEGSLPAAIVNMFIVDGPHTTLENLRERVQK